MARPGRRNYVPTEATNPQVAAAIRRVFDHWRAEVETLRARLLRVPAERLAFQATHRRCRAIEIVLRGLYGRQQVGEADLCRAISTYARHVSATKWYHDEPALKIFSIDRLLGDEAELARWLAKGLARTVADERRAEQALTARRRAEQASLIAEQRAARWRAVQAEVQRIAHEEPELLARLEEEALSLLGPAMAGRARAFGQTTITTNRNLANVVHVLVSRRLERAAAAAHDGCAPCAACPPASPKLPQNYLGQGPNAAGPEQ